MAQSLFEFGWEPAAAKDDKIYGAAIGTVVDNVDLLGEARVQLSLPFAPGFEPWARVATLMAGSDRGCFFIPQIGDEVVVAFNHGDIREPFVIGCLWNTTDRPPTAVPLDSVTKRMIRTPLGQEITLDDLQQSIEIGNELQYRVTLGPENAEIASAGASVTLDLAGTVTISGAVSIELEAPQITIRGGTVEISGGSGLTLDGGLDCTITANQVNIG